MGDFNHIDAKILLSLFTMLIFMSVIIPGIGLTDETFNVNEIPSVEPGDLTSDIRTDVPEFTATFSDDREDEFETDDADVSGFPREGTLSADDGQRGELVLWEDEGGVFASARTIVLFTEYDSTDEVIEIGLEVYTDGDLSLSESDEIAFPSVSEGLTGTLGVRVPAGDLTMAWEVESFSESNGFTIDFTVIDAPPDPTGFLEGIPVISSAISIVGSAIAFVANSLYWLVDGLVWIATIIAWLPGFLFDVLSAVLGLIWMIAEFMINLVGFIFNGFVAMIQEAPGPASVFALLITALFSVYVTKFAAWTLSYIPTVKG